MSTTTLYTKLKDYRFQPVKFKNLLTSLTPAERREVLNEQDGRNCTLMHYSATFNHLETAKCIMEFTPAAEVYEQLSKQDAHGCTALHKAIYKGHSDVVLCILEKLVPKDLYELLRVKDGDGCNSLHFAVLGNQLFAIRCILECMLRRLEPSQFLHLLNEKNSQSRSPLEEAERSRKIRIVSCIQTFQLKAADMVETTQRTERETSFETTDSKTLVAESDWSSSYDDKILCKKSNSSEKLVLNADFLLGVKVLRPLDEGGQAEVYEGTWSSRQVAIKEFKNKRKSRISKHLLEECKNLCLLRHHNIVYLFGIGLLGGERTGLVMEMCDCNLLTLSQTLLPDSTQELMKIIRDAVCGLAYIHSKNMIHMDIKPQNILVKSGTGKLADLGLTSMEDTFEDMLITVQPWEGTSLYKAPELLHRSAPTKAADMWSMGLTTLEVVTGRRPYQSAVKYRGYTVPRGVVSQQLPVTLSELTPRNQSILKQVLNFKVEERESAEGWLNSLKKYK